MHSTWKVSPYWQKKFPPNKDCWRSTKGRLQSAKILLLPLKYEIIMVPSNYSFSLLLLVKLSFFILFASFFFVLLSKNRCYAFNHTKNINWIHKTKSECNIQGGPKKSLWCDLEEKCWRNSKIFFDGVFLSIYSHLLKKLEISKLGRKKVIGL